MRCATRAVFSRRTASEASRTSMIALSLLILLSFHPASVQAIDRSLCSQDGVTEIPPFADGRDANQCLMIDPGNGDPPVPFQYEIFHRIGMSRAAKDSGDEPPGGEWIDHNMNAFGRCKESKARGEFCSQLIWDTTFDNYLSQAGKNDDVLTFGSPFLEYLYFKNVRILNGWLCKNGSWRGPNGLRCTGDSNAHSDGIQMRGSMANDGWLIFQDSAMVNGHTALMRLQAGDDATKAHTNLLFQGFQFGITNSPIGASKTWIDDCYARGSDTPCRRSSGEGTMPAKEVWYVDVFGEGKIKLGREGYTEKFVAVNTGCGQNGCGGEIQFNGGWPHPMKARGDHPGPGVCPNGYIGNSCQRDGTACFCYTSLEAALADRPTSTSNIGDCPASHCPHKAPPFIQLSSAGWENPPDGVGNARPQPPVLLPE